MTLTIELTPEQEAYLKAEAAEQVACERTPNRLRLTRRQCKTLREAGELVERYELIDGEILSKMSVNPPHSLTVIALRLWLSLVFGGAFVRTEATIDVGEADPEHNDPLPDASVTLEPYTAFADHHPRPSDLVLVAEVSDSTLRFDRTTKAAFYALLGIREYWILDVANRRAFVHRQPEAQGYARVTKHGPNDLIATLARPDNAVRVADLFPPQS